MRSKLHPQSLMVDETKAIELARAIRGSHRDSTQSVMGRVVNPQISAQAGAQNGENGGNPGSAAASVFLTGNLPEERILDFVCETPPADWVGVLEDAFTPPNEDASQYSCNEGAHRCEYTMFI